MGAAGRSARQLPVSAARYNSEVVARVVRDVRTGGVFAWPPGQSLKWLFAVMLGLSIGRTNHIVGQTQTGAIEASAVLIRMDDDFAYQIVDYGLGTIEVCDNRPVRNADVFWLRIRLTNESAHLLASPRYFDRITVADNWGNSYRRVSLCRLNRQNRYKPGESVVETVTVDASEFVDDVTDLRATVGGGPAFVIRDPVRRVWLS